MTLVVFVLETIKPVGIVPEYHTDLANMTLVVFVVETIKPAGIALEYQMVQQD